MERNENSGMRERWRRDREKDLEEISHEEEEEKPVNRMFELPEKG